LAAAIEALADRMPILVEPLQIPAERLPGEIESSLYFVISEALTNVMKHAQATSASVRVSIDSGLVRAEVSDDGVGSPSVTVAGHGLGNLADRVVALDGTFRVDSEQSVGTTLRAEVPIPDDAAR
jgi:signal transduction histidine kinase